MHVIEWLRRIIERNVAGQRAADSRFFLEVENPHEASQELQRVSLAKSSFLRNLEFAGSMIHEFPVQLLQCDISFCCERCAQ
jgi:hypothetical protein